VKWTYYMGNRHIYNIVRGSVCLTFGPPPQPILVPVLLSNNHSIVVLTLHFLTIVRIQRQSDDFDELYDEHCPTEASVHDTRCTGL